MWCADQWVTREGLQQVSLYTVRAQPFKLEQNALPLEAAGHAQIVGEVLVVESEKQRAVDRMACAGWAANAVERAQDQVDAMIDSACGRRILRKVSEVQAPW